MARALFLIAALLTVSIAGTASAPGQDGQSQPSGRAGGLGVVVGTYAVDPSGACFRCHGVDGSGDAAAAYPRLADQYYAYLFASLRDYAAGVRTSPIMQPIAEALTEQEMRSVSAYYASLEDVDYTTSSDTEPEIFERGRILAAVGAPEQGVSPCANCHGIDGAGYPPAFPFLAGQGAAYLERQLLEWKRGRRGGDEAGIMRHIASRLSYAQIRAVSLYYASLRPDDVAPGDVIEAAERAGAATDEIVDAYPVE